MSRGFNNPNVIPCRYCRGKGWVRDPFLNVKTDCPECGGVGWFEEEYEPEVSPVRTSTPQKQPMSEAERQHLEDVSRRQREFDKFILNKLYNFFLKRPFEAILGLFGSKRYLITWKHYVSIIWWIIFIITFFIYTEPEVILILGFYIIAVLIYYVIKERMV